MLDEITQQIELIKKDQKENIALELGFTADNYYTACEKMVRFGTTETHHRRAIWG